MTETTAYRALALQVRCRAVNLLGKDEARASMLATIARIDAQIGASKGFIGSDVRLVVLPEYFLTSFPVGDPLPAWRDKAAIAPDGAEATALAAVAQKHNVFLAGNAYETDPGFPDLYFQSCLVWSPSGELVLRYRRLISMFAPSPWDVWDAFLDRYGIDAVFPVAATEIGKLAAIASEEILYPEIARAHAVKGAEILLHSTSETGSPDLTPKDIAKRARALENLVYVVSANSGGIEGTPMPENSTDGMSKLIDYTGRVLAVADTGETMAANAELDLAALRRNRARVGMGNLLARQALGPFSETYAAEIHPKNTMWRDGKVAVPDRSVFVERQRNVIAALTARGVL
ncbi:nitrilase-related carbon-nitrogen hydrolase [Roseiterribacter gracilis]|uniref:Hydrolase n=1 Tax=Roseiterribacter gracilis TaxID=2812848 RepID=A0A8S8XEB7_9PROT|nr:hydrolase [Rhodospirillales bacterium TMPK1]